MPTLPTPNDPQTVHIFNGISFCRRRVEDLPESEFFPAIILIIPFSRAPEIAWDSSTRICRDLQYVRYLVKHAKIPETLHRHEAPERRSGPSEHEAERALPWAVDTSIHATGSEIYMK
jgi:hypothetical protein